MGPGMRWTHPTNGWTIRSNCCHALTQIKSRYRDANGWIADRRGGLRTDIQSRKVRLPRPAASISVFAATRVAAGRCGSVISGAALREVGFFPGMKRTDRRGTRYNDPEDDLAQDSSPEAEGALDHRHLYFRSAERPIPRGEAPDGFGIGGKRGSKFHICEKAGPQAGDEAK